MHVVGCIQSHRYPRQFVGHTCGDLESLAVPGDGVDVVAPAGQLESDPGQAQVENRVVTV